MNYCRKLHLFFYAAAAALLPNIFLFNLYNRNHTEIRVDFGTLLLLALVFAVVSIAVFVLLHLIMSSAKGALLIIIPFWTAFWLFETMVSALLQETTASRLVLLGILLATIALAVFLLRLFNVSFARGRAVFHMLSFVICLLFVFNVMPFVGSSGLGTANYSIRKNFTLNGDLPNPDVHWLMPDGMINFTDFEAYFNDPQHGFRAFLTERGFVINQDARYVSHNTRFGIPGLFSPDFYDSFLATLFAEIGHLGRDDRTRILNEAFEYYDISLEEDIAPYAELFRAFMQAGYTAVTIAPHAPHIYPVMDHFYRLDSEGRSDVVEQYPFTIATSLTHGGRTFSQRVVGLADLLARTTPLSLAFSPEIIADMRGGDLEWLPIPDHTQIIDQLTTPLNLRHERAVYRAFIDSLSIPGPRMTYTSFYVAHGARWSWQAPGVEGIGAASVELYPAAHTHAAHILMNLIDLILEDNPNAVIVIQSDHGFHLNQSHNALIMRGYTREDTARLHNSVMSAVRIPTQYGGLDEPLDPRNITRELVNRFVGANYELLP